MGHSASNARKVAKTKEERDFEKELRRMIFFVREAHANSVEFARTGLDAHRCYEATVYISASKLEFQVVRSVADSSPPSSTPYAPFSEPKLRSGVERFYS